MRQAVLETPCRLTELLSTGDLAGLYYGAGVAHYHSGDQEGAIARWTLGVRHCPDEGLMRFNLGCRTAGSRPAVAVGAAVHRASTAPTGT